MRSRALCLFLPALLACGGCETPSLNGIFPRHVFPARSVEIIVSGDNTQFDAKTTVDFGPDIEVTSLQIVSPTQLVCVIDIALTAAIGSRDVKVKAADATIVAKLGLDVNASLAIDTLGSPIAQGSITEVQFRSLDPEQPLTALAFDPIDGALMRPALGPPEGGVLSVLATVDVFAAPGPRAISMRSQDSSSKPLVSDANAFTILEATPTPIALPSSTVIVFDTQSKTYSVPIDGLGILSASTRDVGGVVNDAWGALVPTSGVVSSALAFDQVGYAGIAGATRSAGTYYVTTGALHGVGDDDAHTLTLDLVHTPVAALTPETMGSTYWATAQILTSPAIIDGSLNPPPPNTAGEEDTYGFMVPSGATVEFHVEIHADVLLEFYRDPSLMARPSILSLREHNGFLEEGTFYFTNTGEAVTYFLSLYSREPPSVYTLTVRVVGP